MHCENLSRLCTFLSHTLLSLRSFYRLQVWARSCNYRERGGCPTAALCPPHYKSPRHQPLSANESSLSHVLFRPFRFFQSLTLAFQRNCCSRIESAQVFFIFISNLLLYITDHSGGRQGGVFIFSFHFFSFITIGILFGWVFSVLRAAHFWVISSNTEKLGVENEQWGRTVIICWFTSITVIHRSLLNVLNSILLKGFHIQGCIVKLMTVLLLFL